MPVGTNSSECVVTNTNYNARQIKVCKKLTTALVVEAERGKMQELSLSSPMSCPVSLVDTHTTNLCNEVLPPFYNSRLNH